MMVMDVIRTISMIDKKERKDKGEVQVKDGDGCHEAKGEDE